MKIRLPADLKDQIETASKNSGRSMNAEIVARLEGSFSEARMDTESDIAVQTLADRLEKQDRTIATLTNLAYTMAVLSNSKDIDGLDITAGALKALLENPKGRMKFDQLVEQFNENMLKTDKPSKRMARIKKPADH